MNFLAFEWNAFGTGLLVVLFLVISVMMGLIVLIQRPQGGGLSGAFGGSGPDGAGQTAFGAKTGDVLTTVTISIFVLFILAAIGLNYVVLPPRAPEQTAITAPSPTPANPTAGLTATPVGGTPVAGTPAAPAGGSQVIQTDKGTITMPAGVNVQKMNGPPPGVKLNPPPAQPTEPAAATTAQPAPSTPAPAPTTPPATSPTP